MPEETNSPAPQSPNALSRTRLLIVALIVIVAVLLVVAISSNRAPQTQVGTNPTTAGPSPTPYAHSLLSFSPNPLTVSQKGTLNVVIDSMTDQVTAVQLELSYDPKALTNVDIGLPTTPDAFFTSPIVLLKKINQTDGKISYLLGRQPTQPAKGGKGTVAVITFQTTSATGQTTISFLPKTLVAAQGVDPSVLKNTTPGIIIFGQ